MTEQEAYEIRRQATSDVARRIPAYLSGSTVETLNTTVRAVQAAWDRLGDAEAMRYCPGGMGSASAAQLRSLVDAANAVACTGR